MIKKLYLSSLATLFMLGVQDLNAQAIQYITKGDKTQLLQKQVIQSSAINSSSITVEVNEQKTFQSMEGFGFALTGGSAGLIDALPAEKKTSLLKELFGAGPENLGISYIRISMGASDLDATVFSYCDLPKGETDPQLTKFNLSQDTLHLIPMIQAALKINPKLKIMASPWSPPVWMKSNGFSMGGHLLKQYYDSYALYFVKYIKAMKAKGITIHSLTMQNEPEHGGNNPSLLMDAEEQKVFLRDHLGPLLAKEQIKTEVLLYDHNADHPNYPISILDDPKAKAYAAGSAFHLYLGNESALSKVHEAHPDKKLYFTEQWTGAKGSFDGDLFWHTEHIVIGTINHRSSAVIEWNLAANAQYEPHTPGGCTECKGALTIQGEDISRNVSYYIIGHASKFVPAGSKRIETSVSSDLIKTSSFIRPDGKKVTLLLNTGNSNNIKLTNKQQTYSVTLPAGSVSTIVW
jgi:glucosylceramidase